jgi:hypothetical protein
MQIKTKKIKFSKWNEKAQTHEKASPNFDNSYTCDLFVDQHFSLMNQINVCNKLILQEQKLFERKFCIFSKKTNLYQMF